jgi:hypothetical protein
MGHGREQGRWFKLAHELAMTDRYKNVAEVEAALQAREPGAVLPADKVPYRPIADIRLRSRGTSRRFPPLADVLLS